VTEDAYCRTYTGVWVDTVLFMLSSDGSDLLYSTFFGGSDWDFTMGASVDDEQSVYLAGETWSTDLPTTPGAYRRAYNGGQDCFAAKMPYPYRTLSWCTYLGGTGDETVWAMEMDSARNVYVTGPTSSEDYPVTPEAYQPDGPLKAWTPTSRSSTPRARASSSRPTSAARKRTNPRGSSPPPPGAHA